MPFLDLKPQVKKRLQYNGYAAILSIYVTWMSTWLPGTPVVVVDVGLSWNFVFNLPSPLNKCRLIRVIKEPPFFHPNFIHTNVF